MASERQPSKSERNGHEPPRPSQATDVRLPPRDLFGTLMRLGPGMIIAGSIVGSGELIATTKVGAEAGFWLLWLIVIGCIIKVSTQIEFARHTITWGETPLKALDGVPGPRLRVNWLLLYWTFMTILVVFQQGGILGGVGQTLAMSRPLTAYGAEYNRLQDELTHLRIELRLLETRGGEESRAAELQQSVAGLTEQLGDHHEPKDPYLWAAALAAVTSVLLYVGRYRAIQWVATVLVATFTLVTILTLIALQVRPEWAVSGEELVGGMSFRLPPRSGGVNPLFTAFGAFGIIGVGAAELIMYPYWCLEKGYARHTGPRDGSTAWADRARGWIRVLHVDAWTSMVVYTFATVAFYLLGAAVLGRIGLNPDGRDMVRTLASMYIPVFGPLAHPIFLAGAFTVLYSTLFVAAAGNSRMVADALGLYRLTDGSESARVKWTRRISTIWPFMALVLYGFVRAPAAMIVACGIAQSIMLPLLGAAALYFRYRRSDPRLQPGRLWDAMLWIAFAAFIVVGVWSVFLVVPLWFWKIMLWIALAALIVAGARRAFIVFGKRT
jgi:Mn2+/Fe2+ NRAMP family transporter